MQPEQQLKKVSFPVVALRNLRSLPALDTLKLEGDYQVGVEIVRRALEEPVRQIANNAGLDGSIVVFKVKEAKGSMGYNADKEVYEDLIVAGVIDPTKVTRVALQNAASLAGLMLMTEATITDMPEPEKPMPAAPPGGGGMPGMY